MEISDKVADHRLSCEYDGVVTCADHECPCPGMGLADLALSVGELAKAVAQHRLNFGLEADR